MTQRASTFLLFGAVFCASAMSAQRGPVPLRGVVYDSLRGHPLRNAFVTVAGYDQPIMTDSRGRFRLDSVTPGVHVVTAQHALFDSIGLTGLSTRAMIGDDNREIELAIPSFETLWRLSCRNSPPSDSGIVYGTIRDAATGQPVANADVELSWWDLRLDARQRVRQRTWRVETKSNGNGGYAVCGVAPESDFRVHAVSDSRQSGFVDMPPSDVRVQRRDLLLGPSDARPAATGTIVGIVTDPDGHGIEGARVLLDGSNEVRTRAGGEFTLPAAPAGTRKLEVLSLGAVASLASVDVTPGDTALVSVTLRYGTMLDGMRTSAASAHRVFAAEFDARRERGFAYARDSTELIKYNRLIDALRDVPSMRVQFTGTSGSLAVPDGGGGFCAPAVLIDGVRAEFGHLIDLMPAEVGAIEVYQRAAHIPARFVAPGFQPQCGMILVWTKYGLSNR